MNVKEYKFNYKPEVKVPTSHADFVRELQTLCNKYSVVLKADREENILINTTPDNMWLQIYENTYVWGELQYELEQHLYEH